MAAAWGAGIATFSGERVLEVFYPDPKLGTTLAPGFSELSVEDAEQFGVPEPNARTICATCAKGLSCA
jgi:hypothetical protein